MEKLQTNETGGSHEHINNFIDKEEGVLDDLARRSRKAALALSLLSVLALTACSESSDTEASQEKQTSSESSPQTVGNKMKKSRIETHEKINEMSNKMIRQASALAYEMNIPFDVKKHKIETVWDVVTKINGHDVPFELLTEKEQNLVSPTQSIKKETGAVNKKAVSIQSIDIDTSAY
jgi:hypothetical protein